MVKDVEGTSRKWRRNNLSSTSTLTLDTVDILVYDFSLTKIEHLRQTTIKIIKEKMSNVSPDTTQRGTRSMLLRTEEESELKDVIDKSKRATMTQLTS